VFEESIMLNKLLALFLLLGLLVTAGCMCDTLPEDDIPWNKPDLKDGMMPLPNSMLNRYN